MTELHFVGLGLIREKWIYLSIAMYFNHKHLTYMIKISQGTVIFVYDFVKMCHSFNGPEMV